MTIVEMCVHMDCAGCESKIRKALQKLEGVDGVEIDMASQKVTVTGHVEQKKVLKAVRRTGRRVVLWPFQYGGGGAEYNFSHQNQKHHPALVGAASSSYNYYKHGYDDARAMQVNYYGYYQPPTQAVAMFSDDNPNACHVM
ncbi:heavy metal-associated isoprenylated plant protein 28-like [Curcuma longa]|uniref:heavy metal-associated isoprenylated plant protein 28-like n=1 Tax=Curcuma longa TaxID=136217 RepID=UPI003D9DB6F2